jgi:hypothetical protein
MSLGLAVLLSARVETLSPYFWRVQMIQASFAQLVSLWAVGYVAAKVTFRLTGCNLGRWNAAVPVVGILSVFVGFILVDTYYYCPVCRIPPGIPAWCEVGIAGVPIPSRLFIYDWPDVGPRTEWSDSCGEFSEPPAGRVQLNPATVANFVIGIVALPLILALPLKIWNRKRRLLPPANAIL